MKVLVAHNHYLETGGEDAVVESEIKMLEERGHAVIRYTKSNEYLKRSSVFRKAAFAVSELNFSRRVYDETTEIIRKERPDIAHIHNIFFCITPSIYYALKDEGVPIVQSFHNYRFFCLRGAFFDGNRICEKCKGGKFHFAFIRRCWKDNFFLSMPLVRFLYKAPYILDKIDSYIATSEFARGKLAEFGLERKKTHLKTNFMTIEPEAGREDKNFALFIGRFVDYKGVETLMDACRINPGFNLKIIGDGPLRDKMRDFAASRKNIELLGKVDREKLLQTLRACSFVIFPSTCYENMPLVIMESFAFSKPVLASNLGSVREFVIDGVSGILFEPGDARDLAEKISAMFADGEKRRQMGKNANDIYRERFNKERNYKELIDIYNGTIKSKKG